VLSGRLVSVDAYRGFVMLLLLGEVLRFCAVAAAVPDSAVWAFLCHHQSHVAWVGASLHDLIQPSFSLLVGTALAFSVASRSAAGQSRRRMFGHAAWRALVLVLLGIWLRSIGRAQTYFTFEDTLTQIGLGYLPLFLLARGSRREQWVALGVVLVAYGGLFALYPAPPPDFDYATVAVPPDWPHHETGFAAHWNKNSNLAWAFDVWFLNLFPREQPFVANRGGYATLSFIPTLGTMILGLLAGGVLRDAERTPPVKIRWLLTAGAAGIGAGWLLHALGINPLVKRIWTPSFTLWSGGACFLILAAAYYVIDVRGHRGWAFPLVVPGMNSIAAYCLYEVGARFIGDMLTTHFGRAFTVFGAAYTPFVLGLASLAVMWLVLYWMYRRSIFLRI
jgi:predicted acyltransferase